MCSTTRWWLAVGTLSLLSMMAACGSISERANDEPLGVESSHPQAEDRQQWQREGDDLLELKICDQAYFPEDLSTNDWNKTRSRIAARMSPRHAGYDVLTTGRRDVVLSAEFGHGPMVKDVEQEIAEVWIDDCGPELRKLGSDLTDDEGRVVLKLSPEDVPAYGQYQLFFRLVANDSLATATLRVLPPGTKLAVFDIDGTLTTGTWQTVRATWTVLGGTGDYIPSLRPAATDVANHRAYEQGYIPVYLTGRPYWMTEQTRRWLVSVGAAWGHLRTTGNWSDWMPTHSGVGEFKAEYLQGLIDEGFDIGVAYGNSHSDAWAYLEVGLQSDQILIVGEGGDLLGGNTDDIEDTTYIGEDYVQHVDTLQRNDARIDQPFRFPRRKTE